MCAPAEHVGQRARKVIIALFNDAPRALRLA